VCEGSREVCGECSLGSGRVSSRVEAVPLLARSVHTNWIHCLKAGSWTLEHISSSPPLWSNSIAWVTQEWRRHNDEKVKMKRTKRERERKRERAQGGSCLTHSKPIKKNIYYTQKNKQTNKQLKC